MEDNIEHRYFWEEPKSEWEKLHEAVENLKMEICKALYIPQLVEWLSKKLNQ